MNLAHKSNDIRTQLNLSLLYVQQQKTNSLVIEIWRNYMNE
jgi:hypothetical protein